MLKDRINFVLDNMQIMQGRPMMPSTNTMRHMKATDREIKSALERRFGWVVSTEAIRVARKEMA